MFSVLPLHLAVMPVYCSFSAKFVLFPQFPTFIQKFLTKFFCSIPFTNVHQNSILVAETVKPTFTPNQWHQTVVC